MTALAIRDEQHYLATIHEVRDLAERIDHVEDAKALADKAAAAQVWARRAKLGEEQVNLAAVAKLWAERRAGELLAAMPKNGGGRPPKTAAAEAEVLQPPTLAELGVDEHESRRWQQLAEIPPDDFEQAIEQAQETGQVTATAVRRLAVPISEELLEEQQRKANVNHLSSCLRGLEIPPEIARSEIRRLTKGSHPFTPERFDRAAAACEAYAAALREEK